MINIILITRRIPTINLNIWTPKRISTIMLNLKLKSHKKYLKIFNFHMLISRINPLKINNQNNQP